MNVLLMRPLENPKSSEIPIYPDMGLGMLAATVRKRGHQVSLQIRDVQRLTDDKFRVSLQQYNPQVVGLKVLVSSVGSAIRTIRLIREAVPKATVLIGGPQPSGDPRNILDYIPADYAFAGEAEIGLPMMLEVLEKHPKPGAEQLGKIPGLVWKNNRGQVVINPGARVYDLDSLGWPAWDLMPPDQFAITYLASARARVTAPVVWSRGCQAHCTFCAMSNVSGRTPRSRSPQDIVSEARMLKERYGVGELVVLDDNFGHSDKYVIDVSRALYESGLGLWYQCQAGIRLGKVTAESAYWMRKGGCYEVHVGIESGSDRILKMIKKGITVEIIKEKVKILTDAGVAVAGYFIMGFPGETRQEIAQTYNLSAQLNLSMAHFSIYNPLPGTEMYETLVREGNDHVRHIDWNKVDWRHFENNLSEVPFKELRRLQKKCYWRFYLRPRTLMHSLSSLRSVRQVSSAVRMMIGRYVLDG